MKNNLKFFAFMALGLSMGTSSIQAKATGDASEAITEKDYNDTFGKIATMRRKAAVKFSTLTTKVNYSIACKVEFEKFKGKTWKELLADRKTRTNDDETKTVSLLWK